MKFTQVTLLSALALVTLVAHASASRCPKYLIKVVKGTAHDAHGLTPVVDKFRKVLGGEDNGNDPPTGGKGQRSINWDADIVPFDMPFDFFNTMVPRGAIFTALNAKFAVSNPAHPPPKDDRFSSIIGKFLAKRFVRFSLERLFTPVDDNEFLTHFEVPGARFKKALTRGFGAVFTDVVYPGPTKIVFYDEFGCVIAAIEVPPREKGLSFVGIVVFDKHYRQLSVISNVGIVLGEVPISHVVKGKDLVVVDDLIYGEPVGKKKFDFYGKDDHHFHDGKDFHDRKDFHRDDHFDH